MEKDNIECPYCKSNNIRLVLDQETFDGPVYSKKCMNCGRKFQ